MYYTCIKMYYSTCTVHAHIIVVCVPVLKCIVHVVQCTCRCNKMCYSTCTVHVHVHILM